MGKLQGSGKDGKEHKIEDGFCFLIHVNSLCLKYKCNAVNMHRVFSVVLCM